MNLRYACLALLFAAAFSPAVFSSRIAPRIASGEEASIISLRSQRIDINQPPVVPSSLQAGFEAAAGSPGDQQYVMVKFPGPVTAEQYGNLAASVEKVYTYLPYHTFLVKTRANEPMTAATVNSGAIWAGPYHPAYKLSPSVTALMASGANDVSIVDERSKADHAAPLLLLVYPDAKLSKVINAIRSTGISRIAGAEPSEFFSRVRLLVTPQEIAQYGEALARIPEVFWMEAESRRVILNDTTVWVGQSGLAAGQTTPIFSQGIFGQGQVVGIIDTGLDADMCFFRDAARGLPPRNECNGGTVIDAAQRKVLAVDFLWSTDCAGGIGAAEWDNQGHGTHVAGTVAGDNLANGVHDAGDGMAPAAKLVIQDAGFGTDNCADLPGIGCPVVDLKPIFLQAYQQGARIHSNSWGDRENFTPTNIYSVGSQDADEFMWTHKDFLLVFAAGNAGPGTGSILSPATGKNVVAVGATLRGTSAGSIASFSSCGPTDDARIKPDVTLPGSNIISAANDTNINSNNCATRSSSGTSMAAPAGAGLTALIRQYYTDGFYPSGVRNAADSVAPSAALLKATLLNSAHAMENVAAPIPSNCQGWGRALLDDALFFAGQQRKLWINDDNTGFPLGSVGERREFRFRAEAGQSFKATLVWTDFPSTPAANPHLNNDLDLTVIGPGGTFRGNVFSSGQSVTGGAADRRNTVEQVLLTAPVAGEYVVQVQSANIPSGAQPFALVVTGDVTPCGATCAGAVTVFFDDFETEKGWTRNALGTDTATLGLWERGNPEDTNSSGLKQLGTTVSGVNDLVTGRLAGASAGAQDVDGGTTSIQSPAIVLPSTGNLTLSFSFYLAHGSNATNADAFRLRVLVGTTTTTVFERLGSATNVNGAWQSASVDLNAFRGQTVRLLIEAVDAATASLVEAAVDDLKIVQQ